MDPKAKHQAKGIVTALNTLPGNTDPHSPVYLTKHRILSFILYEDKKGRNLSPGYYDKTIFDFLDQYNKLKLDGQRAPIEEVGSIGKPSDAHRAQFSHRQLARYGRDFIKRKHGFVSPIKRNSTN